MVNFIGVNWTGNFLQGSLKPRLNKLSRKKKFIACEKFNVPSLTMILLSNILKNASTAFFLKSKLYD